MQHINLEPQQAQPLSYADSAMRLFEYNGQLLRGVSASYEPRVRELFSKGALESIVARGLLVQTTISEYTADNYPLVLEHEKIPVVTYPTEWPPEALRAAGMAILDLQEALLDHGYMIIDVSPWNVMFRRSRPVFVDFGSITSYSSGGVAQFLDEFNRYYFWPLQLAKKGLWHYVVHLFGDYNNGVRHGDYLLLSGRSDFAQTRGLFKQTARALGSDLKAILPESIKVHLRRLKPGQTSQRLEEPPRENLRNEIERLRASLSEITLPATHPWARYYEEFPQHGHSFDQTKNWTQKQLNVRQAFSETSPKSLFDICSNRGWYSLLAESMGMRVISADVMPEVMNQLYLEASKGDHEIYPVVMDFCYPSPARGVANNWFKAATERFRSDMVVCLAALHHLIWSSQLSFDQVVAGLASFSKRWLLIEFIPREDETAGEYWTKRPHNWYTEEHFARALEQRFHVRRTFSSFPEPRKLFLCELKQVR
jgi:hypothetical protein